MPDVAAQVKEILDLMPSQINAEATKGLNAVIQFNLTGQGGGSYYLEFKDGVCTTGEGARPEAKMTMTINAADYIDLIAGKLNGQMAFMSGKLKIAGDMGLAMKMQSLIKRPA